MRAFGLVEVQGHGTGSNTTHDILPLGANIPDVGTKTNRQANRHQHQRGGFQKQFRYPVNIAQRADKENSEAFDRIFAQRIEQNQASDHHQHDRQQWRRIGH